MQPETLFYFMQPTRGPSGALNPDAYTPFKKLHLQIEEGYQIAGLEPNAPGSFVLLPGTWKRRGG